MYDRLLPLGEDNLSGYGYVNIQSNANTLQLERSDCHRALRQSHDLQ